MPSFHIETSKARLGAEILGADLSEPLSDEAFARIEDAVDTHAVVAVRDQRLSPGQLVTFASRFGPLQVNVRAEANNAEHPQLFFVSNVTRDGKPLGSHDAGRYWHSDLCYLPKPSRITLLNALEVPVRDGKPLGDTEFIDTAAAYDELPPATKDRLASLRGANGYRFMWNRKAREFGKRKILDRRELQRYPPDALHPVARTHPRTGRKCLYVCDGYTHRIEGLEDPESRALLDELFAHLQQPEFRHRHRWQVGDVLIWDNCTVQHKAVFDYEPPLRRVMQRCTVEGSEPF